MKLPVRILASALAVALAVPGLLAALSACAMADCGPAMSAMRPLPASPAGGHDCCPPAAAAVAADCCSATIESPAASAKVPEPLGAAGLQLATVQAMAQPDLLVNGRPATLRASRPPLDSLSQGCILRI